MNWLYSSRLTLRKGEHETAANKYCTNNYVINLAQIIAADLFSSVIQELN